MAFLERVKEDFNKRYGGGKAATAQANSLNKEFGYFILFSFDCYWTKFIIFHCLTSFWVLWRSKLKEHMQYCMDHPDEISKLAKVKAQVSEVKGVMMENIEKVWSSPFCFPCCISFMFLTYCLTVYTLFLLQVLDRGEKIELLVDKTENLRSQVS